MLARGSAIVRRGFSKDYIKARWRRSDPNRFWRVQHKLPMIDEEHGPLADLPDYSYINGEPTHLNASQRKTYDFNVSVVQRIHELDNELTRAKSIYAEKIASNVADYKATVDIAKRIETSSHSIRHSFNDKRKATPSISHPYESSLQPNLLNALRDATTYNEAYEEVVDPVGAIVPNNLMNIERPPYKRTGERRRYHKVFTLRAPRLGMFPR